MVERVLTGYYGEQGIVIVDDDDSYLLNKYTYRLDKYGYAKRATTYNKKSKKFLLHREIMGVTDPKIKIDHKDGNKLNNRRDNLRLCTPQQNSMNRKSSKNSSSKYKGVTWDKERNKWKVNIMFNGKSMTVGRFDNENDAGMAYNKKASELFGEFASLNVIK